MNDFRKGIMYGAVGCAAFFLVLNISLLCYKTFATGGFSNDSKMKAIYQTMEKYYMGDMDEDKIYEGIYAGMVYGVADNYTRYISAEDYDTYKQQTNGNYCGIGAVTTYNAEKDWVEIEGVYKNSPAENAGIQSGDVLKQVENTAVTYDTYSDAIEMIRGEENTDVNVTIFRPDTAETLNKTLTRSKVDTQTVAHSIINNDIGYLRITAFEEVTKDQFKENVKDLKNQNIKSLIIDLRNNPGGLLTTVTDVVDEFLPKEVITYTEDKNGKKDYVYATDGEWDISVVILVNGNSASASELMTGALKDYGVAKVVGKTTYGKGVVQTTFPFKDGSALKLTTAKYYTPNGVCIDGVGIEPDYVVEANEDYRIPFITDNEASYDLNLDPQLKKAVEILE